MGHMLSYCLKLTVLTFCVIPSILIAQNDFCIENVQLFNGEKVLENINVKIVDGIIDEVSSNTLTSSRTIDGQGKFLMPAMTNAHVHAWAQLALIEAARAGVLNVLDMHGVEVYQGFMKKLQDSTNYATYYMAGAAATAPEGHGTQFGFPTPTLNTPEEAENFVDQRIAAGADYIKIIVEPWKATLDEPTVKAIVEATHRRKKLAVSHVSRAEDAQMVVKNNVDGLVHLWWDRPMRIEEISALSKSDVFVVPTLLTNVLATEQIKKNNPEANLLSKRELLIEVKKLYDAGIPLLTGTDPPNVNINFGKDLYKEIQLLSEAGIPNLEVLKAATSLPASCFKLDKKGFVKKGFKADLVLIDGNPLENIEDIDKIEVVWKNGQQVNRQ